MLPLSVFSCWVAAWQSRVRCSPLDDLPLSESTLVLMGLKKREFSLFTCRALAYIQFRALAYIQFQQPLRLMKMDPKWCQSISRGGLSLFCCVLIFHVGVFLFVDVRHLETWVLPCVFGAWDLSAACCFCLRLVSGSHSWLMMASPQVAVLPWFFRTKDLFPRCKAEQQADSGSRANCTALLHFNLSF